MKKIPLTQGQYAIVDDDDFERVSKWKWFAVRNGSRNKTFRVCRMVKETRKPTYLHHLIIGMPKKGQVVDHINGDPRDNRKKNLRFCSVADNIRNQVVARGSSGVVGVSFKKNRNTYNASICVHRKRFHLGAFKTLEEATRARKKAVKKYWST